MTQISSSSLGEKSHHVFTSLVATGNEMRGPTEKILLKVKLGFGVGVGGWGLDCTQSRTVMKKYPC